MPSNQCCSCRLSEIPEQRPLSGTARYALFRRFEFVGKEIFVGIRDVAELHRLQEGYIMLRAARHILGSTRASTALAMSAELLLMMSLQKAPKSSVGKQAKKLDAVQSSCDFIAIGRPRFNFTSSGQVAMLPSPMSRLAAHYRLKSDIASSPRTFTKNEPASAGGAGGRRPDRCRLSPRAPAGDRGGRRAGGRPGSSNRHAGRESPRPRPRPPWPEGHVPRCARLL